MVRWFCTIITLKVQQKHVFGLSYELLSIELYECSVLHMISIWFQSIQVLHCKSKYLTNLLRRKGRRTLWSFVTIPPSSKQSLLLNHSSKSWCEFTYVRLEWFVLPPQMHSSLRKAYNYVDWPVTTAGNIGLICEPWQPWQPSYLGRVEDIRK